MSTPAVAVSLPGFHAPAAGFEAPFEMLQACHQRVERMLDLLERLQAHAVQHGCDTQVQQAASDVMRYFDQAAPLHHQDEELHIFPALLAGPDRQARELAQALWDQHRTMEALWAQLRDTLVRMRDAAPGAGADGARPSPLQAPVVDAFCAVYRAHIALEEQQAYPAAQAVLGPLQLEAASEDMMQRRGVRPVS